jgi:hypothetical protein
MFEDKLIFGGLYRAKDLTEAWKHTSHPDLSMNDQRYNFWIPIKFSGNKFVAPGYYMIDTYQVSSFNSYRTSFKNTILPRLISFGEDGDSAYYGCGDFYYNSRVRLTDETFELFELVADLREYTEIPLEDSFRYAEADVLRHIKLYREHNYPSGICLVKKDAQFNMWNQVEVLCDKILENMTTPRVAFTATSTYETLMNLINTSKSDGYNKERVEALIKYYQCVSELQKEFTEKMKDIQDKLGTIRYEWLENSK